MTKFSGLGADLAGINFSDLKHCVAVLRVNTMTRFVFKNLYVLLFVFWVVFFAQ